MATLINKFLAAWLLGAVILLLLSFTVYRKSYYYRKARAEMAGKAEKPGIASRMVTGMILAGMILALYGFDQWISADRPYPLSILVGINLLLAFALSLFDALFIDIFLLLTWRPALLGLPKGQPTREYMKKHIKKQFSLGWIYKGLIALAAAVWSHLTSPW